MLRYVNVVVVFSVLVAWSCVLTSVAHAEESKCSLETFKGDYVFDARGFIIVEEKAQPYAEAGNLHSDGEGNVTGVFSAGLNGASFESLKPFTGTYTLNPNCTGFLKAPIGDEVHQFDMYTTPKGEIITYSSSGFSGRLEKQ